METESFDLGVLERMLIIGLIPPQGDITRLRQLREFRERMSFSDEERTKFGIEQLEGMNVVWKTSEPKTYQLSPDEVKMIKSALRVLDREKQLTVDHIPLWDQFIGE